MSKFESLLFVCLLTWFFTYALTHEIEAKPGDDVLLNCQDSRNGTILQLRWIKSDLRDGYVYFFREYRSHEEYQSPAFRGRVELKDPQMKDGDVSVILKNFRFSDTGTYECKVGRNNTGSGPETINVIDLKVKAGCGGGLTEDGGDKDGGDKDGGDKDGGDKDGRVSLIVVLSVVVLLLVVVDVVVLINRKRFKGSNSDQRPADEDVEEPLQNDGGDKDGGDKDGGDKDGGDKDGGDKDGGDKDGGDKDRGDKDGGDKDGGDKDGGDKDGGDKDGGDKDGGDKDGGDKDGGDKDGGDKDGGDKDGGDKEGGGN